MQEKFLSRVQYGVLTGFLLAGAVGPAVAALGKPFPSKVIASPSSSVPGVKLQAMTAQGALVSYRISETVMEGGTTIREYAASTGPVFAISWSGPLLPELGTLLGDYFNTFNLETSRARAQGRRGSPFMMDRDGLVVRSGGRMGSFSGYAYVPDLVPTDVNINDVVQ